MEYTLKKSYTNHSGLDLKSTDLTRPLEFASGMKNAQYRKSGAVEKRKGYQGHAPSAGGNGTFTYGRVNPTTGAQEPEVLVVSDRLYKKDVSTLTVTYVGADPSVMVDIFFDVDLDQYVCRLTEGTTVVLESQLGQGFDETPIVTIDDLRAAIDALANFTASVTGATTTPAAFLKTTRGWDLSASGGPLSVDAAYFTEVNKTSTSPLAGSETNRNALDFENVSAVQIQNVMYFSNGYDEVHKYDGQTFYRAGLPTPTISAALVGGGSVTGSNYLHRANYVQIDAAGNVIEGNARTTTSLLNAAAESFDVTVANIQAGSGFNTNCAIVAGAQATVNTIVVDNGSGGTHTMQVGDTAYFYDGVSAAYVEREITATTNLNITVAGAPVTVADNAVISNNLRIAIFRSKTAGATPSVFYLVEEIPNNSFAATQVLNDDKTDAQLGAEFVQPLADRSPPPKGKYISVFRNQAVIAGKLDQVNTFFWSDVDGPEYFPPSNQNDVTGTSGDKIFGIAPNNEVFAIFQYRAIHIMSGNIAENTIRVDQLTSDIGCAAHATIKEVRGSLYFLSDRGPYQMTGGQLPTALGDGRIEPVFQTTVVSDDLKLRLQRATALNQRDAEQYWLFIPTESVAGDRYANEFSPTYAYDYYRGAWLQWDNINMAGGATMDGNEVYFSERRNSTFAGAVTHVLYRQHNLNDAYDYQDNVDPIDWQYDTQWEALGEPSVFKRFLSLRLFALDETPNNDLMLTVKTEVNYTKDDTKSDFDVAFTGEGYGVSAYGASAYGDPAEPALKNKLGQGRFRSLRFRYSNARAQENVALTGWEVECATPYKMEFKP